MTEGEEILHNCTRGLDIANYIIIEFVIAYKESNSKEIKSTEKSTLRTRETPHPQCDQSNGCIG